MIDGPPYYILSTHALILVNDDSIKREYTRVMDPKHYDELDPEGVHLAWKWWHCEGRAERFRLMIKKTGDMVPADCTIDVHEDTFKKYFRRYWTFEERQVRVEKQWTELVDA